jgi:hypothetical protein
MNKNDRRIKYVSLLDSFGTFYQKEDDDYAVPNEETKNSWQYLLFKKFDIELNKTTLEPLSQNGSCIEYIQWALDVLIESQWETFKNATFIVGVPDPNRIWFCEYPSVSHIANLANEGFRKSFLNFANSMGSDTYKLERQMHSAFEFAANGCYPRELAFQKAKSFIAYIHYIRKKYNLNIIALPISESEESIGIQYNSFKTHGTLQDIQFKEIAAKNDKAREKNQHYLLSPMSPWLGTDGRVNHLIKENHEILAEKIYNSMTNNVDLDLSTGFVQNVITKENCIEYKKLNVHKQSRDTNIDTVYNNVIANPF